MRIVSLLNQKGGVGKTTTTVNLGAALALEGCRVVVVDLDPQANLSVHLGVELADGEASSYAVLLGNAELGDAMRPTATEGLSVVATDLDLSGAELELANQFGRETLLRDAIARWRDAHRAATGEDPADYVLLDCPPSLGLLSINALAASDEVLICVQTEFFALRGLSKLIDVVTLVQRRLHPALRVGGILPCLYDSRLKLAREVLAELKAFFGERVFPRSIGVNVKLAEAPSYGQTIFEYAPDSPGARDYRTLAQDLLARDGVTPTPRPAPPRAAPARPFGRKAQDADAQAAPHEPGAADGEETAVDPARASGAGQPEISRADESAAIESSAVALDAVENAADEAPASTSLEPERASGVAQHADARADEPVAIEHAAVAPGAVEDAAEAQTSTSVEPERASGVAQHADARADEAVAIEHAAVAPGAVEDAAPDAAPVSTHVAAPASTSVERDDARADETLANESKAGDASVELARASDVARREHARADQAVAIEHAAVEPAPAGSSVERGGARAHEDVAPEPVAEVVPAVPPAPADPAPAPAAKERLTALARYAFRSIAGDVTPEGEVRDVLVVPRRGEAGS